jgi:hypothetical protein
MSVSSSRSRMCCVGGCVKFDVCDRRRDGRKSASGVWRCHGSGSAAVSGADVLGSASARLLIVGVCMVASSDPEREQPEVPPRVGVWVGYGSYPVGYGLGMDHAQWGTRGWRCHGSGSALEIEYMTVWQAGSMVLMVHERLLQQITHVLRWWVRQVRCVRSTSRWSKISQWGMALAPLRDL